MSSNGINIQEVQDATSACKAMFETSKANAEITGGDVVIELFYVSHKLAVAIIKTADTTDSIKIDQVEIKDGKYILSGVKVHPDYGLKVTLIESDKIKKQKELEKQWNL